MDSGLYSQAGMGCPSENALLEFGSGRLGAAERDGIEAHIDTCAACMMLFAVIAEQNDAPTVADDRKRSKAGPALASGAVVRRYVILDCLGRGGMGEVYRAYDHKLRREVALKLLFRRGDPKAAKRMLQEARAMAQLSHPNVVPVYDVDDEGGRIFIAMELVEGGTLGDWIERERPKWRAILSMFIRAGEGLLAAHAGNVVHRDFKPQNVMVGRDGRPRVLDFGLARSEPDRTATAVGSVSGDVTDTSPVVTETGLVLGTPAYMAPEQHHGEPLDARCDQYAFCVSLFEALAGRRPFGGAGMKFLLESKEEGPSAISTQLPVSAALRRAILRGLEPDPDRRHPSMRELLAALRRAQRRSRLAGVAGAVGVVAIASLGIMGWGHLDEQSRRTACTRQGETIGEVWNSDVRDRVRQRLESTDLSFAAGTAAAVAPILTEYAEQWQQVRTDVCSDQAMDAKLEERARWCLDGRSEDLELFVEELLAADATVVREAVGAAARLESPAWCADQDHLRFVGEPSAEGKATRALIRRAAVFYALGKDKESADFATRALADARRFELPGLEARAELRLGMAIFVTEGGTRAEQHLVRAYFRATEADLPGVMAESAIGLVLVLGNLARPSESAVWGRHAEAALRTTPSTFDLLRASRLTALGSSRMQAGELESALAVTEEALSMLEGILGPEHPRLNRPLRMLASIHEMMGDPETAKSFATRSCRLVESSLGPDHPVFASALMELGAAEAQSGDLDEGIQTIRRAMKIRERALGPSSPRLSAPLTNLASLVAKRGEYEEAETLYRRAVTLVERDRGPDHPVLAFSLLGIAGLAIDRGRPEAAIEPAERALRIREARPVATYLLAWTRFVLAQALWKAPAPQRDRERAMSLARSALDGYRDAPGQERKVTELEAWLGERSE